jgi:hypothetical protein
MPTFRIKFKVTGNGHFPIDMLRYDHCYPVGSRSIEAMMRGNKIPAKHSVELAMEVTTTKSNATRLVEEKLAPTVGRWNSFSWEVSNVEMSKLENL